MIGTGDISNGNVASARKDAISDALVKGVEGFLTRRLGSEGMVNNFSRIIHDIIPAAEEGTENFHILAEEQTSKHYKILVQIKVNAKLMEERFKGKGEGIAGAVPHPVAVTGGDPEGVSPGGQVFVLGHSVCPGPEIYPALVISLQFVFEGNFPR